MKIENFHDTKCGAVLAKVAHLSYDAVNDEKKGLIYASRLTFNRAASAQSPAWSTSPKARW
jgi:hemolysin D